MRSRRRSPITGPSTRARASCRPVRAVRGGTTMAVALSESAVRQVKTLKQAQNLPETVFLRMGVKGGGCSGMTYSLEFDSEMGPHDKEFEVDGVRVIVDRKSYLYLNGTTL